MSDREREQDLQANVEPEDGSPSADFPIVGIGASAGGLEAIGNLLDTAGSSTGMAFVVVVHLERFRESEFDHLLSQHTSMSVEMPKSQTEVKANSVYVIPPNTSMSLCDGRLMLTPRSADMGHHTPIDYFLSSLAREQKSRSVGVVLSGGGSDGSVGLEAIKAEGGVTFAQDGSAPFESMPLHAVSTGVVDFVLNPRDIGRELATLAEHLKKGGRGAESIIEDGAEFAEVLSALRHATGVDFAHYKSNTLKRRLWRRMGIHHLDSLSRYLKLIERNPGEVKALFDDVLITVTDFFRDPAVFDVLSTRVFPELVKSRGGDDTIRVWVPGCSSGKEVYSFVIALIEFMEKTGRIYPLQIFGTDINESAIETARHGRYPASIAASLSPQRLDRFFIKLERGYQVTNQIREHCVFSRQDLTKDPPLSRMDIVSCRNLLIYLGPVLQRRVLSSLGYALKSSGYLVLGTSETVGPLSNSFQTIDPKNKIYLRNGMAADAHREDPLHSTPQPSRAVPRALPPGETLALDGRVERLLLEDYAPSGLILDSDWQVLKFRGNVGSYLSPEPGDAMLDVLRLVRGDLAGHLRECLEESRRTNLVSMRPVQVRRGDKVENINVVVRPFSGEGPARYYLVVFETGLQARRRETRSAVMAYRGTVRDAQNVAGELASTRTYTQRLVEELRSANEEAQSSNEELQSTNEELQTAKEELQSSNEELTTTNEELRSRNRELGEVNGDLLNVLSSMQVPIVMLTSDLRIRRYTPVSSEVLNLLPTDVGRPITDLNLRIRVPDVGAVLHSVIRSKASYEREVQNDSGHWFSMRVQPYRTAEGGISGAVLQFVDIDPIRKTLSAVEHARDYAQAIFSNVREPLVVLDGALRVRDVNHAFISTFQIPREDAVGSSLFEVGARQWDLPTLRTMLTSISGQTASLPEDVEIDFDLPARGRRNFLLSARRVPQDHDGSQVLLTLEDVTDRKRAAEAKYRRLFETTKDGILLVNGDTGQITDANPYLVELLGIARDELIGKEIWKALPFPETLDSEQAWQEIREAGDLRLSDVPFRTRDGRKIDSEIVVTLYTDEGKPAVQFNVRETTQRKRFEQQLLQTAKLESLGILAGGIAHDFNNLLTGIMGNASLALTEAPPDSEYQGLLKEVVMASQGAADLTGQMLAYAGKGRYVTRPLDISELVRDIGVLVRSSVPKWVTLQLKLADRLPLVEGDPSQLQQVLMNLVINAAESVPPGRSGCVRIRTRALRFVQPPRQRLNLAEPIDPGDYLLLQVTDNGSGMDHATLQRIFDPFFSTKFTGRGLGLAAVQGIVRSHRGSIQVRSLVGRGTSFRVLLPATKEQTTVPPPALPDLSNLRGTGLVLLVDDEQLVTQLAQKALASYGYQVITAENGAMAVDIVGNTPDIRLVILDRTMPVMGGEEALLKIRRLRPGLPVLLSSGFDMAEATRRFGRTEISGFIQKPFTIETFLRAVKDTLDKYPGN